GKELSKLEGHEGILSLAFSPDGRTLAVGGLSPTIHLWELASGKERALFAGHNGVVLALAFAANGRMLASGGGDTTALVWDVTGRLGGGPLTATDPHGTEREAGWTELRDDGAGKASEALWLLASAPKQTVPFLRKQMTPAIALDTRRAEKLIKDLSDDSFEVREKAMDELRKLGSEVAPLLRKAVDSGPDAET